jgi:TatA/E family protein of Tat protein translocase
MFGPLGFQELLFILGLALLIFGPRELPRIGRTIGRAVGEFRKASNELKRSLNVEMIEEELRQSDPRKLVRDAAKELETAAMAVESQDVDAAASDAGAGIAAPPDAAVEPAPPDTPAEGPATVPRDRTATAAGS